MMSSQRHRYIVLKRYQLKGQSCCCETGLCSIGRISCDATHSFSRLDMFWGLEDRIWMERRRANMLTFAGLLAR